jgi:hypothetical protein
MLMQDASWQNQVILQWLSESPTAQIMDMEMDNMHGDYIGSKPLIQYLRYNFAITENNLNGLKLGKQFTKDDVDSIVEMSNAHNREILYDIGLAASNAIKDSHFGYSDN